MATNRWYALVIQMTTGAVVHEIPLTELPQWTQQINQPGTWTVKTQIGGAGGIPRSRLRQIVAPGRWGVAICYGDGSTSDYVAQAGPIWTHQLASEQPPILQIGGGGLWGMFTSRIQVPGSWTASAGLGSTAAIAIYGPASMQGIAVGLLTDAIYRGSLPVDVPAATTGSITQTYYGYDLATVGQRLQELTQGQAGTATGPAVLGPDILFTPYRSDPNHIRWTAQIGNPYLVQPGLPLIWDYGGALQSVLPTADGSKLATTVYVKANGVEAAALWATASDPTLTNAGWPLLEWVDTSHSSEIDPVKIQGFANADQALYGRPVETWAAVVRSDLAPIVGTYSPGMTVLYNMVGHPWIPDGTYSQRLIGMQSTNTSNTGEVGHILQAIQGAV